MFRVIVGRESYIAENSGADLAEPFERMRKNEPPDRRPPAAVDRAIQLPSQPASIADIQHFGVADESLGPPARS
jgi:hypothetical protein